MIVKKSFGTFELSMLISKTGIDSSFKKKIYFKSQHLYGGSSRGLPHKIRDGGKDAHHLHFQGYERI